ncbi:hypothetical protein IKO70_09510 [bacterium]|jgi:hypothetical protein|nr:hypothetical protein [bacterium]
MKKVIFSMLFLFGFSIFGKTEPGTHSTSDFTFRMIGYTIVFIALIVFEIWYSNKKEKKTNELKAKEKPLKIFEYCKVAFGYNDELSAKSVALGGPGVVWGNVLLFQNRIGIVTENVLEIEIKDINFIKMKKVLLEEMLQVNFNEISKSGTKKEMALYLKGSKEDLLYIKNFIEERLNRPQVIDLTED